MVRTGVKVVVRTRPTASFAEKQIQIDQEEALITIHTNRNQNEGPANHKEVWKFRYHQVLHNASQETVYDAIAKDIVKSAVIDGINGTILAYGQTGSGKSFTMIGDTRNYYHRGIAPRAIAQLFSDIQNRLECSYSIHVSYMEIYNDKIYDLLAEKDSKVVKDFVIVEDMKGTTVRGLCMIQVENEKETLDQLFHGELQRTIAEHQLNKRSNRSHCIFTFHISQKSRMSGTERLIHSKLHLVDLAGSERLKKTMKNEEDRSFDNNNNNIISDNLIKKESMYINQSLTYLEQCIVALGSREQRHVPYRQTKITNILKDSLGGNSNTLMFSCIWGESKHLEETISTLKLAQRMMRVQNETTSIIENDPLLLLKKYEKQIRELKQELIMHDALVERVNINYDPQTPEQINYLCQLIRKYIDAKTEEEEEKNMLPLTSLQQIKELFKQFKLMILNTENGSSRIHSASLTPSSRAHTATTFINGETENSNDKNDIKYVGEKNDVGFALGIASSNSKPVSLDSIRQSPGKSKSIITNALDDIESKNTSKSFNIDSTIMPEDKLMKEHNLSDKNDAFKYFKVNSGKVYHEEYLKEKESLKKIRENAKILTNNLNKIKEKIDLISNDLKEKQYSNINIKSNDMNENNKKNNKLNKLIESKEDIIDEEEFLLLKKLKEIKKEYRTIYHELKEDKDKMDIMSKNVDILKFKLVEKFEEWFTTGGKTVNKNKILSEIKNVHINVEETSAEYEEKEDKLDDGEAFDRMEMERIIEKDPESLAFFQAQKKMRQTAHSTSPTNSGARRKKNIQ